MSVLSVTFKTYIPGITIKMKMFFYIPWIWELWFKYTHINGHITYLEYIKSNSFGKSKWVINRKIWKKNSTAVLRYYTYL